MLTIEDRLAPYIGGKDKDMSNYAGLFKLYVVTRKTLRTTMQEADKKGKRDKAEDIWIEILAMDVESLQQRLCDGRKFSSGN